MAARRRLSRHPAKLIFLSAASLSFRYLPEIAYWLTIAFTVATLGLIAFSPTTLRFPRLAALLTTTVPIDPEVYGVSEYAFWWGSLWSFVAVFWKEGDRPRIAWRCALVAVGGLSSPMAVPAALILAYRAAGTRRRSDAIVLGVATAAAVAQIVVMSREHVASRSSGGVSLDVVAIVERFFGDFASWRWYESWRPLVVGGLILMLLAAYIATERKWRDPAFVMLLALLGASILASLGRAPLAVLDPVRAGQRYFFYPYLLLSWLLLFAAREGRPWQRTAALLVLIASVLQFAHHGQRMQERISWRDELDRCRAARQGSFAMPIQYDGEVASLWHVPLSAGLCESGIASSLIK